MLTCIQFLHHAPVGNPLTYHQFTVTCWDKVIVRLLCKIKIIHDVISGFVAIWGETIPILRFFYVLQVG